MATYGRWGKREVGVYYCSNCGAGLPFFGSPLSRFEGKVNPGDSHCPNCLTHRLDQGLVYPVGKGFKSGPAEQSLAISVLEQ